MSRRYLSYLLTVLIALQSVVYMADAHRFHQSGTEHLEFDHSHQLVDTEGNSQLAEQTGDASYDCHHCCHCHAHAHSTAILTGIDSYLTALFTVKGQADYQANLTSVPLPSLLRPPIA